jgi:RsiW-degrading membrane proteinase PrsW (M82 family)
MTNTGPSLKNQAGGGSAGSLGVLLPVQAWVRNPSLRSWPTLLFVVLVAVPPVGLVLIPNRATVSTYLSDIDHVSWLFAVYFAVAWLLLIGVIVRPAHVTKQLLVLVVVIALGVETPIALAIESRLHANPSNLGSSIFVIGLAEELAKAIPVLAIALLLRKRLSAVDYLFLGAVSGLVFGASEAVEYLTQGRQLPAPGSPPFVVEISALSYVWRFLTDPIGHACWAGLTGYFIGLAVSGRYRWYVVGWVGLLMAMVLHGLNDWGPINSHWSWVVVVAVSAILFVAYAKAGVAVAPHTAAAPGAVPGGLAPAAAQPAPQTVPAQAAPASAGAGAAPVGGGAWYTQPQGPPQAQPAAAVPPQPTAEPAGQPVPAARGGWWQSLAATPLATTSPGQPAAPRSKPWWEE